MTRSSSICLAGARSSADSSQCFAVRPPAGGPRRPLLVHVPHASLAVPAPWRETIVLDDEELEAELLAMTDRHTDELFAGGPAREGVLFVNSVSRLVFDPERFANDGEEEGAPFGMGAVYTRTSGGRPLRAPDFGEGDRAAVMNRLYDPYAAALADEVDKLLARFGRCLIVDGHSFPTVPLAYEDPGLDRPDVCIGYEPFHCPEPLVKALEATCREENLRPARNTPFAGSYVPMRHYRKDERVRSVMIELRRGVYMDEATGERGALYPATVRLVADILARVVQAFEATG